MTVRGIKLKTPFPLPLTESIPPAFANAPSGRTCNSACHIFGFSFLIVILILLLIRMQEGDEIKSRSKMKRGTQNTNPKQACQRIRNVAE